MKHILEETVYYADTDSYGVVWHGTYLRWMEKARVEFCREIGLDLVAMKADDIMIPVTNLSIRYKSSAKLDDKIVIETSISKVSPIMVTFSQIIRHKDSDKVFTIAELDVVAVNSESRIYRRMPEKLKTICENAMK